MSIAAVDDEGERIRFPVDPSPRRGRTPKETPPDKPLDAQTTKMEICRAFATIYNLGHKIVHDDLRYSPADFAEEADGLLDLMNQHAPLRVVLRVLTPLAAIGALIEKVQGTIERLRARRKAEQPPEEAADPHDNSVNPTVDVVFDNAQPTTSPVIDRGFFTRSPLG